MTDRRVVLAGIFGALVVLATGANAETARLKATADVWVSSFPIS